MVSVIADVLKFKLSALDWIERFGGLVVEAKRPTYVHGADGQTIITGNESWPIACDVNAEKCFENTQRLKWFVPDSSVSAVAYFLDVGGTTFAGINESPRRAELIYRFNLRFVCWMNMKRLGDAITEGECYASGRVVPYLISTLFGEHSASDIFGPGTVKAKAYRQIEVTGISELQKSPALFAPFTFATLPDKQAMFIWPYDYFALQITGTFIVNRFCLADLYEPPFVPDEDICLPVDVAANRRVIHTGADRVLSDGDFRIYAE